MKRESTPILFRRGGIAYAFIGLIAALLVLTLSGCASKSEDKPPRGGFDPKELEVKLKPANGPAKMAANSSDDFMRMMFAQPVPPAPEKLSPADEANLVKALEPVYSAVARFTVVSEAREAFMLLDLNESEAPRTKDSDDELQAKVEKLSPTLESGMNSMASDTQASVRSAMRRKFSDADFEILKSFNRELKHRASMIEGALFAAVDANSELFKKLKNHPQYGLLGALKDSKGLKTPQEMASVIEAETVRLMGLPPIQDESQRVGPVVPAEENVDIFHPWGVLGLISAKKDVAKPRSLKRVQSSMLGAVNNFYPIANEEYFNEKVSKYQGIRNRDNPTIPTPLNGVAQPVRVTILDSGLDFVERPQLSEWLAPSSAEGFGTHDEADGDGNPWAPRSERNLNHGTYVSETFFTVLGKFAADPLKKGAFQYAFRSIDSKLGLIPGAHPEIPLQTLAISDAIRRQIEVKGAKQTQVMSLSLITYMTYEIMKRAGKEKVLLDAPWLWVMGAGNDGGEDAEEFGSAPCFAEFASEERPAKKILCVGSIVTSPQGEIQLAQHTNIGPFVDVYTSERYVRDGLKGTSFAAPAISAVAAVLLNEYPKLTAELLKKVIVGAAEEREVQSPINNPFMLMFSREIPKEKIRVFDPETPATWERARALAAEKSAAI